MSTLAVAMARMLKSPSALLQLTAIAEAEAA